MSDHMQQAREMLRNADAAIVVRELLKARDGVAEKWREAIAERDALAARVGVPSAPVEAAPEAPAEPVAPDRDEAIRIWRKHCAPFSNKLGAHPPSVVVAAMMDFASAAIAAARAEGAEQMRDVLQRCVKGIDRLSELARLWEPDHSSGADRRGWVLAKDARDDAAELLRSLPVEAPNAKLNGGPPGPSV